ncbi:MAG: hypothetical protein JXA09_01945 [Anaerolineae bacterium]|nr:hypothetical protein [Anaerolineae bacterium]
MAGQRPSLAGRGVETLFGEQPGGASHAKAPHREQVARDAPAGLDPELAALLEAEARSALVDRGALMGGSRSRTAPVPGGTSSAAAPKAPVRPTSAGSAPKDRSPVVPNRAPIAAPAQESPGPKRMDAPPAPAGPQPDAFDLRAPAAREEAQPAPARREGEVADVGDERRQALWDQITVLYREVPIALSAHPLQDEALQLLQEAQDILIKRPREFDLAQYKVGQVHSIVVRRKNTARWTSSYGWATLLYEVFWVAVLAHGILLAPYYVSQIEAAIGGAERYVSIGQLWNCAAWGGVGGVLGALYSLYWHAAKVKDFDKQYVMWYVVQPLIGLIIGALVYAIVDAGFLSLVSGSTPAQELTIKAFPYTLACIAAFRQRFILEIVDRLIQVLAGTEGKAESAKQQAARSE